MKNSIPTEKAIFAAGCFWGVEALFRSAPGVVATRVGYIGGHVPNPTYPMVCTDQTGHAEAIEIEYDPATTSYQELLDIFWNNHDPTSLNRQGPDKGRQYRSAIFTLDTQQDRIAHSSKEALDKSGRFKEKIVTEIVPASQFYLAEDYHQNYYIKHGITHCPIIKKE